MTTHRKHSKLLYYSVPVGVAVALLFFQNCTQSGFSTNSYSSQTLGSTSTDTGSSSISDGTTTTDTSGSTYVTGQLYGACTMQLDNSLNVVHNSSVDKNGNKVASADIGGFQSYPIANCPSSGNPNSVTCADGFKPVQKTISQMSCASSAQEVCKTYWITFNCVKL